MTYVYFLQAFDGGPIKIGRSRTPEARLRAIQGNSPVPLDLICKIPGDEVVEQTLHRVFASGRLHGEWFDENTPHLAHLIEELIEPKITDDFALRFQRLLSKRYPENAEPDRLSLQGDDRAPTTGG